jgi:hypothetical protein
MEWVLQVDLVLVNSYAKDLLELWAVLRLKDLSSTAIEYHPERLMEYQKTAPMEWVLQVIDNR